MSASFPPPRPAARGGDSATDGVLLSSLEIQSSLYHLGQYCGNWSASTGGRERASFHLVLHGQCWLHLSEDTDAIALNAGDGVFFLRDVPHRLAPHEERGQALQAPAGAMSALSPARGDGTGLACGFFEFRTDIGGIVCEVMPDFLVLRGDDPRYTAARALFDLILQESQGTACPALIERLTNLLVFYALRPLAATDAQATGLLALAREPAMAGLLQAIMAAPGQGWTLQDMARHCHMSAATFHRRFTLLSGSTPALVLQQLRMRAAARLLAQGWRIGDAAEHVGYRSAAAFSRLFRSIIGQSPGQWQRTVPGRAPR